MRGLNRGGMPGGYSFYQGWQPGMAGLRNWEEGNWGGMGYVEQMYTASEILAMAAAGADMVEAPGQQPGPSGVPIYMSLYEYVQTYYPELAPQLALAYGQIEGGYTPGVAPTPVDASGGSWTNPTLIQSTETIPATQSVQQQTVVNQSAAISQSPGALMRPVIYRFILPTGPTGFATGANYPGCGPDNTDLCDPQQIRWMSDVVAYAQSRGEIPYLVESGDEPWAIIAGQASIQSSRIVTPEIAATYPSLAVGGAGADSTWLWLGVAALALVALK